MSENAGTFTLLVQKPLFRKIVLHDLFTPIRQERCGGFFDRIEDLVQKENRPGEALTVVRERCEELSVLERYYLALDLLAQIATQFNTLCDLKHRVESYIDDREAERLLSGYFNGNKRALRDEIEKFRELTVQAMVLVNRWAAEAGIAGVHAPVYVINFLVETRGLWLRLAVRRYVHNQVAKSVEELITERLTLEVSWE